MRRTAIIIAAFMAFGCVMAPTAVHAKAANPKSPAPELGVSPSQCEAHLAAYRDAIQFVEGRMEHSPVAITYVAQNGDSITVENRVYRTLERNRQLLVSGFVTKARRCRQQQSG